MSFDEFYDFQEEIEKAQKEQDEQEKLNRNDQFDDFGFGEVLEERQKHKYALRERLEKQNFTSKEIEKLFNIISKAEEEMEIVMLYLN